MNKSMWFRTVGFGEIDLVRGLTTHCGIREICTLRGCRLNSRQPLRKNPRAGRAPA